MILRYSAFTDTPEGGNPAGVVLDASDPHRRADAADREGRQLLRVGVRHAARARPASTTSATSAPRPRCRSAATRRSPPPWRSPSATAPGRSSSTRRPARCRSRRRPRTATLTSVAPHVEDAPDGLLDAALTPSAGRANDLDPELPPKIGLRRRPPPDPRAPRPANAWPTSTTTSTALKQLMLEHDLTTVDLVHREDDDDLPRAQPVPRRRRRRGPRDRRRRRRVRRLPAAQIADTHRHGHDPPGRRHGPPEPARRSRSRPTATQIRVSGRAVAM